MEASKGVPPLPPPVMDETWAYIRPIARGGFSQCFLYGNQEQEQLIAVKMIVADGEGTCVDHVKQEIRIHKTLHHPNILPLTSVRKLRHKKIYFMITPYMPRGSLKQMLGNSQTPLGLPAIKAIVASIGKALVYLKEKGVLHRDVKPANILMETECSALLCDFGLATRKVPSSYDCGTDEFKAPEITRRLSYSYPVDMYALGKTLVRISNRAKPRERRILQLWIQSMTLTTPQDRPSPQELVELIYSTL